MDAKLILLLLAAILHKVASTPESVFALEGNSATLIMRENDHLNLDYASWTFNESFNVVRYYPHYPKARQLVVPDSYKGRVEFNNSTFSLELRNLQKNDSGLYRGEIMTENKTVAEYRLSVFEPVSTPNLTVDSNWSSSNSCNVTLTCSSRDLSVTFICNDSTCMQKGGASTDLYHKLVVMARDDSIVCNHSNRVSWSEAVLEMGEVCDFHIEAKISPWLWIGVKVSVGLTAITAFALLMLRTWKDKCIQGGNATDSDYEVAHPPNQAEAQTLIYTSVSCTSQHVSSNRVNQNPQDEGVYSLLRL